MLQNSHDPSSFYVGKTDPLTQNRNQDPQVTLKPLPTGEKHLAKGGRRMQKMARMYSTWKTEKDESEELESSVQTQEYLPCKTE